jgi:hypothetical protein
MSIYILSLARAVGIPGYFVTIKASQPKYFDHVYPVLLVNGRKLAVDASVAESYLGWEPSFSYEKKEWHPEEVSLSGLNGLAKNRYFSKTKTHNTGWKQSNVIFKKAPVRIKDSPSQAVYNDGVYNALDADYAMRLATNNTFSNSIEFRSGPNSWLDPERSLGNLGRHPKHKHFSKVKTHNTGWTARNPTTVVRKPKPPVKEGPSQSIYNDGVYNALDADYAMRIASNNTFSNSIEFRSGPNSWLDPERSLGKVKQKNKPKDQLLFKAYSPQATKSFTSALIIKKKKNKIKVKAILLPNSIAKNIPGTNTGIVANNQVVTDLSVETPPLTAPADPGYQTVASPEQVYTAMPIIANQVAPFIADQVENEVRSGAIRQDQAEERTENLTGQVMNKLLRPVTVDIETEEDDIPEEQEYVYPEKYASEINIPASYEYVSEGPGTGYTDEFGSYEAAQGLGVIPLIAGAITALQPKSKAPVAPKPVIQKIPKPPKSMLAKMQMPLLIGGIAVLGLAMFMKNKRR